MVIKKQSYPDKKSVLTAIRTRNGMGLSLGSGSLNKGRHADPCLHKAGIRFCGNWQKAVEAAGFDYVQLLGKSQSRYPSANAVLEEIRNRHHREFTLNALEVSRRPGPHRDRALFDSAKRFFGSWGEAVEAAGVDYAGIRASKGRKYPDDESVVAAIQRRAEASLPVNYKAVHQGEYADSALLYSARRYFGSWGSAIEAAGIDSSELGVQRRKYPDAQSVVAEIQHRYATGLPNNFAAVDKEGSHRDRGLLKAAYRCFGSWPDAVEAAGFKARRGPDWTRKFTNGTAVVAEIQHRHAAGIPINYQAIAKARQLCDRGLLAAAREFHGSWQSAVEAAGFDYQRILDRQRRKYPDADSVIAEICHRKKAGVLLSTYAAYAGRHRDKGLLYATRREFGSWDAAVKAAGIDYAITGGRKYPSAESVVNEIQRRRKEGLPIHYRAVAKGGVRDLSLLRSACKILGSWRDAIEAAGFDYRNISREQRMKYPDGDAIIAEIRRRLEDGKPLKHKDVALGVHSDDALLRSGKRCFGSWSGALKAAGVGPA